MIAPLVGPANPLVMILLENPLSIDRTGVMQALERLHPDHYETGLPPASSGRTTPLRFDGHELGLMTIDAPLPEQIVHSVSRMGAEATAICARHQAHVVVGLKDPVADALVCARVLTAVAGAVIAAHEHEALGALWDGKVMTSTAAWQHLSPDAYKPYPDLPVDLWIRIMRIPAAATGEAAFLTWGLERFAGWELEMTGPGKDPRQLALRVRSVARHLVQNGPIFQDGVTYKISATEQLEVRIAASAHVRGLEVLSARLSLIEPQSPVA